MMTDELVWPPLPTELTTNADAIKARAEAIAAATVDLAKGDRTAGAAAAKAALELNQKLVDALAAIVTAGIDRARSGAQFVQTAASAIAGIYTGVLAALFVADHPAPFRSFIPMLFLGFAIALATFYLAFLAPGNLLKRPEFKGIPAEDMWVRLQYVSVWTREIALRRASALRAAVLSLFVGLLFLPVALVHLPATLALPLINPQAATTAPMSDGTASAGAVGAPRPTAIPWPSPTVLPEASLSAVLYAAQLEQFRTTLSKTGVDPADVSDRDEQTAWRIAGAALVLVLLFWANPLRLYRPKTPATDEVVVPEQAASPR
jgi:hypothetical protein